MEPFANIPTNNSGRVMLVHPSARPLIGTLPVDAAHTFLVLLTCPDGAGEGELAEVSGVDRIVVAARLALLEKERLAERVAGRWRVRAAPITPAVRLAKRLFQEGCTPDQVQELLSYGEERVKQQLGWLDRRHGIRNRSEFLLYAVKKDLPPPGSDLDRRHPEALP